MSEFEQNLPEWNEEGAEPDQTKKDTGWEPEEKPAPGFFNWLHWRTYKCLEEIRDVVNGLLHGITGHDHSGMDGEGPNLESGNVGLGNVLNVEQVENAGSTPSIETGTIANRPAAGNANAWYMATDEGILYYDDGTNWQEALNLSEVESHDLGGEDHNADTLANLNSKVSDATLVGNQSIERTAKIVSLLGM